MRAIGLIDSATRMQDQWRKQKIFMGGFIQLHMMVFVFGVRCFWRHNLTSFSRFRTNVLAKFVDTICIFFYGTLLNDT